MSWRLGAHVHREHVGEQIVAVGGFPVPGDVRGERRSGPGVHHVGVADEAAGHAALRFGEARRARRGRVHRQFGLGGHEHVVVQGQAIGIQPVPDGDRHAEEALAADQPVPVEAVHPVAVAGLHVGRVPGELVAAPHQLVAQRLVAATVADVPLAGGHDLQRAGAALVELHRVGDRARLAEHLAAGGQQLHDLLLRLLRVQAGDLLIRVATVGGGDPVRRVERETAVEADEGPARQVQFAPPGDVGDVAEGADHGDAGALLGIGQVVGHHGHSPRRTAGCAPWCPNRGW